LADLHPGSFSGGFGAAGVRRFSGEPAPPTALGPDPLNPPRDRLDRLDQRLLVRFDDRHRTVDDLLYDRCKDGGADDPERPLLVGPYCGDDALLKGVS